MRGFSPDQWSLLFAEARNAGLTSRLCSVIDNLPRPESMPARFGNLVDAGLREGEAFIRDTFREVRLLREALAEIGTPVIVLKGAAYVLAGLPPARGRVFSDIDLLVDRAAIGLAESSLMLAGWTAGKIDAYDQRYYREWAHEIPPLTHVQRSTTVDLHHSLVMPTCRIPVDSNQMVAEAIPLPGLPGLYRLKDEDLVLHACAHLLLNSEFDRGLRDLGDIDLLVRHFSAGRPDFIPALIVRARTVGLANIANRALDLCRSFYRTPVAHEDVPKRGGDALVWLLTVAMSPRHPDTRPPLQSAASFFLGVRELSLRFPTFLLIRHLLHKMTKDLPRSRPAV